MTCSSSSSIQRSSSNARPWRIQGSHVTDPPFPLFSAKRHIDKSTTDTRNRVRSPPLALEQPAMAPGPQLLWVLVQRLEVSDLPLNTFLLLTFTTTQDLLVGQVRRALSALCTLLPPLVSFLSADPPRVFHRSSVAPPSTAASAESIVPSKISAMAAIPTNRCARARRPVGSA